MNSALERLNDLSQREAEAELLKCCGSRRWARQTIEHRPFRDLNHLLETADMVWWTLDIEDWLEAFRSHPKIGERKAAQTVAEQSARWSEEEQAGVGNATQVMLRELTEANRAYEEKFGYIFIVCAMGKTGVEILKLLRERLHNEPETEIRVAAEEQRRITQLRLKKSLESQS